MSEELEALKRIKREVGIPYFSSLYDIDMWNEDFATIETALKENIELKKCIDLIGDVETNNKKLKALEIIKEKRVNIDLLLVCFTTKQPLKNYNKSLLAYNSGKLIQDEYDLLKEVLL